MPDRSSASLDLDTQLRVRGVVDAAAERLREAVLRGQITPGTAITETLVATRFRIARPSAKAAIEKLTAEGLLERSANRSARVLTLDASSVTDIYQTRRRLEGAALRELADARTVPEQAQAANAQILALRDRHPSDVIDHDLAFHLAVIDALQSKRMSSLYRRILSEVRLCMAQVQGRQLLHTGLIGDEHSLILAALNAGNGRLAIEHLTVHLGRAERLLSAALRVE